jgi:hypothetical protein
VTFVTPADFTNTAVHTSITPGWHNDGPAPTSALTGLTFAANTYYGIGLTAGTAGTSLQTLAQGVVFGTTDTFDANFNVAVFYETSPGVGASLVFVQTDPTTSLNPATLWTANTPFGTLIGPHTLADFDTEAATAYPNFVVTGWGFFTGATPITVSDLLVNGTQYIFTPQPVVTTSPASPITTTVARTTGVTVTTNGFLPGETVDVGVGGSSSGGSVGSAVADANGLVTFSYVFPANVPADTYTLTLTGAVPDPQRFSIVVQDPAVVTPVLAETGSDPTFGLTLAGSLLILGAVLAVASAKARRRRPQHAR